MICLHHAQPVVVIVGSQWGTITIGFATSKDSHERKKFCTFRPLCGDGVAQVLTVPFYYVVKQSVFGDTHGKVICSHKCFLFIVSLMYGTWYSASGRQLLLSNRFILLKR